MKLRLALYATIVASTAVTGVHAQPARSLADRDIVEAYEYMLGRWLVLRQENLDFKEGFNWNQIIHREPGGVAWANPSPATAVLTITALDSVSGLSLGSTTLTVPPNAHGAANIGPLLNLATFTGSVQITATAPIVALSAFYHPSRPKRAHDWPRFQYCTPRFRPAACLGRFVRRAVRPLTSWNHC